MIARGGLVQHSLDQPVRPRPATRPGRWVALAFVLVLTWLTVHAVVTNPRFQWDVVADYMFAPSILRGLLITLWLTFICMFIGVVLGGVVALARLSPNPIISGAAWLYIWIFRGTPVLVQLVIWFNLAALYPTIDLSVPFGPEFASLNANELITPMSAAILGLGLNQAAYMAEVIRGGIIAVDEGQSEAAYALGMTRGRTMRRIVLPQAIRIIIPPTGNQLIGLLKYTSLVSVLAVDDLLFSAQRIYQQNYRVIPLLFVAAIWYLIVTSVLTVGQYYLERHYARGSSRNVSLTPLQKLRTRIRAHPKNSISAPKDFSS